MPGIFLYKHKNEQGRIKLFSYIFYAGILASSSRLFELDLYSRLRISRCELAIKLLAKQSPSFVLTKSGPHRDTCMNV